MNGTVGRRVFVGSLAGAGVGALGVSSLDLSLAAQPASTSPLLSEIRGQLNDAFGRMQNGEAAGARQAATVMRVYASTVNDDQVRTMLRKATRQTLLFGDADHKVMLQQVDRLGLRREMFPPHSIRRGPGREAAANRLLKEGLSPLMRQLADTLDGVAEKMEVAARRGVRLAAVRFMQPIPDNCPDCAQEEAQVEFARDAMEIICAVALVFPVLMELCFAASATYVAFYMALVTCNLYVLLCHRFG